MQAILNPWHLLKHPFYRDWMEGKIGRTELRDYAQQYLHHVEAFPRYLSTIHSLCREPQVRRLLLENLNDEEGLGHAKSHPELWRDFAHGLGVSKNSLENTEARPAIQRVMDTFFACARSSVAEGLGALYAYESQIPEIAESKIQGLREHYGINDAASLAFFEVHREADKFHRATLQNIIEQMGTTERRLAEAAAEKAAKALWDFLSEVHSLEERALA